MMKAPASFDGAEDLQGFCGCGFGRTVCLAMEKRGERCLYKNSELRRKENFMVPLFL